MASRRCLQALALTRQATNFLFTNPSFSLPPFFHNPHLTSNLASPIFTHTTTALLTQWSHLRCFSSGKQDDHGNEDRRIEDHSVTEEEEEEEEDDDDDDYEPEEEGESGEDENVLVSGGKREYTVEEKEAEAAAIGYKVVGPLTKDDRVFKPYEPVFAVVQVHFPNFVFVFVSMFRFYFIFYFLIWFPFNNLFIYF